MSALITCGLIVVGLATWIALIRRRDRNAERARGPAPIVPDPILVERAFDPTLCGYCDEASRFECPACTQPLCPMHRPMAPYQFCYACETEWESKAGRRRLVTWPITIAAMGAALALTAGLIFGLGETGAVVANSKLGALLAVGAFAAAVGVHAGTERYMRRLFRKRGQLPKARARFRTGADGAGAV